MPSSGVDRISSTSSILSISPRAARCAIVARDQDVLLDALALLGLLGLGIEQPDDAIGIAHRRHFRIGHDDGGVGEAHGERGAALDAGRAVADHPVEFAAQLLDDAGDALLGQRILVAGLRGRQQPQGLDAACRG